MIWALLAVDSPYITMRRDDLCNGLDINASYSLIGTLTLWKYCHVETTGRIKSQHGVARLWKC